MKSPLSINTGLVLSLPGGFKPGGSQYKGEDGQPRRRFVKSLLKAGEWRRGGDGVTFKFSTDDLDKIAKSSQAFLANGNRITLPSGHDTTGNPDLNRGYVLDVFREGDELWGMVEAIGEDGILAASRSHVSIYAPAKLTDPKGKSYEFAIKHVALTTDPVITDQSDFIPIAASNGTTIEAVPLQLSTTPSPEATVMDLSKLAETLGITDKLTDENAIDIVKKNVEARDAALSNVTTERDGLKTELVEAKKNAKPDITLSNTERNMGRRLITDKLDSLVKIGRLTPDEAKKIAADPLMSQPVMLACGADGEDPAALRILDILSDTDLARLGEKCGRQVIELSNRNNESDTTDLSDRLAKMASGEAEVVGAL